MSHVSTCGRELLNATDGTVYHEDIAATVNRKAGGVVDLADAFRVTQALNGGPSATRSALLS